jgi:hypothetical protein
MTESMVESRTDVNLVALTPADMVPAQSELIAWCDRKIRALSDELEELDLHQKLALENGWKTSVVVSNLNRTARRITYYQKMQAALQAGYLLVPNMPIDVLAVRVSRAAPPRKASESSWRASQANPELLAAGEGRYVDETVYTIEHTEKRKNYAGHEYDHSTFLPSSYDDEVDFPIALTKPVVLAAAARAMALKVFDQIGRVQNGGGRDPILVGQLLDPRRGGRLATFFLAWWVDTSTL